MSSDALDTPSRSLDPAVRPVSPSAPRRAFADFCQSLLRSRLWISLAWFDILQRYRGSMLGPTWLTISSAIFIVGLGPIYGELFGIDLPNYLPYLTAGILVWNFVSVMITESCQVFIRAGTLMKQTRLPLLLHLFHTLARNVIIFAHCIPLFAVVLFVFQLPVTPIMLLAIPGFAVLCVNLMAVGLILAILCTRYRDLIQVVTSLLQLMFFVTPIFWRPGDKHLLQVVSDWNPLSAMIALVRSPLINQFPTGPQMALVAGELVLGGALAIVMFTHYRQRIVYWV